MRLCDNCYRRHWKAKIDKKTGLQVVHRNGRRVFLCINCGHAQEEETAVIPIPNRIKAGILYIDIEISKTLLSNYGLKVPSKHVRFDNLLKERYMICWGASYIGSDVVWSDCVTSKEASRYLDLRKKETDCDERIVKRLHGLIRDADVIAGHNVRAFDLKHAFTRFLYYGLPPIGNKKVIDTLTIARSKFAFESNSLDYISQRLGFRPKDDITNDDWNAVLRGDSKVISKIREYNKGDVVQGKRVHEKLEQWSGKKENFGAFTLSGEEKNRNGELNEIADNVQEIKDVLNS